MQCDVMHIAHTSTPKSKKREKWRFIQQKMSTQFYLALPSSHRPGNLFSLFLLFVTSHSRASSPSFSTSYSIHLNLIVIFADLSGFGRSYSTLILNLNNFFNRYLYKRIENVNAERVLFKFISSILTIQYSFI